MSAQKFDILFMDATQPSGQGGITPEAQARFFNWLAEAILADDPPHQLCLAHEAMDGGDILHVACVLEPSPTDPSTLQVLVVGSMSTSAGPLLPVGQWVLYTEPAGR